MPGTPWTPSFCARRPLRAGPWTHLCLEGLDHHAYHISATTHVVITLTGFTAASRPYENTVSVHPMERFLSRCGRASANGLLRQLHPSTAARVLSACLGAVLCTGPVAPAGVSSINGASILGEVSGGADLTKERRLPSRNAKS